MNSSSIFVPPSIKIREDMSEHKFFLTEPLVSVIIPTYNYGFTISETIESLLSQTFTEWEAIIIDDGSTDNTEEVVRPYLEKDLRITYIRQMNTGVSAARNAAMRLAKGQFIQFLDADDLLSPQKLEIHVCYLIEHPDKNIVFSSVRYFNHSNPDKLFYSIDESLLEPIYYKTLTSEKAIERMFEHNIVVINAPLFRKRIMVEIGLYDELMTSLEDWEYWFRMAIHGHSFFYLPNDSAIALVRVHKESLSWNWNRMTANRKLLSNNIEKYVRILISNEANRNRLLKVNKRSSILYLGFAAFMNIKHYNFWWGIRKAIYWALKYGYYKFFILNCIYSVKFRFKSWAGKSFLQK